MGLGDQLMKLFVQVEDAVALAVHFEASPVEAMRQLVAHVQQGAKEVLERVMDAEIGIFLGRDGDPDNKRNGYTTRSFAFKGLAMPRRLRSSPLNLIVRHLDEAPPNNAVTRFEFLDFDAY